MINDGVQPYLRTLRRIPTPVFLAVATREMEMAAFDRCLVASAIKEQLGMMLGRDATDVQFSDHDAWQLSSGHAVPVKAQRLFGGSLSEWTALFQDVCLPLEHPKIELAFVLRLDEALTKR